MLSGVRRLQWFAQGNHPPHLDIVTCSLTYYISLVDVSKCSNKYHTQKRDKSISGHEISAYSVFSLDTTQLSDYKLQHFLNSYFSFECRNSFTS